MTEKTLRMVVPTNTTDYTFSSKIEEDIKIQIHVLIMLGNKEEWIKLYLEERNTHNFLQYSDLHLSVMSEEKQTKMKLLPKKLNKKILQYFQQEKAFSELYSNINFKFDCRYFVSFINDVPIIPANDYVMHNYNMTKISSSTIQNIWDNLFIAKEDLNNSENSQTPDWKVRIQHNSYHFAIYIWEWLYISQIWDWRVHIIALNELIKLYSNPDLFYTISPKESANITFSDIIPIIKDGDIDFTRKYIKNLRTAYKQKWP